MTVPADRPGVEGPKKIAIVVHQEHSRPGRVGALLEKRGYELHRLCPNLGCNLPEDMSDYAGVVIFGGPMSALRLSDEMTSKLLSLPLPPR